MGRVSSKAWLNGSNVPDMVSSGTNEGHWGFADCCLQVSTTNPVQLVND